MSACQAVQLSTHVGGATQRVGVFVDPSDAEIEAALTAIDLIQLHGEETQERILAIKERFDREIIKAVPIQTKEDLLSAQPFTRVADYLMFDAKGPSEVDHFGGHGAAFDWAILSGFKSHRPWLLAGGLTPENVSEAMRISGARIVDVSSGVERTRGNKDKELMSEFVTKVRAAEQ